MARLLAVLVLVVFTLSAGAQDIQDMPARPAEKPVIDIVFAIDCSGSMGGVIETAKQKVWAIVNEVARARPTPILRIGLYGYGNGNGPFRKFDLTDDLDEVYKNLMTFKDEGWGSEYVGLVIERATNEMKWAEGKQILKVIYVVGNETARQGPVDYTTSARDAIAKGIAVSAIYCGNTDYSNATPTWQEIAKLADGHYMEIAASGGAIVLSTPFDDELALLNTQLNGTYIAYGRGGRGGRMNQVAQDANSVVAGAGNNSVVAERAVSKASLLYRNASWDLVDASREAEFKLSELKDEDLPEELRALAPENRAEAIQEKARQRSEIQAKIRALAEQRQKHIADQIAQQGLDSNSALDVAVRKSIVDQAKKKGFAFETNE